jgi:lysophospholipase
MVSKKLSLTQTFNRLDYQPPGWRESYFTNQYHHELRYAFAPATTAEKKGTVVLTHGYGEFIDLYYLAIKEYQKMGFDVWAMDFYGFGKSGRDDPSRPTNPSTKGMLRHVRDLDFFIKNIVQKNEGKPLLMNTHSMGGHIGLLYLQRHPGVFDGAVMSSPLFDIYRLGLSIICRPFIRAIFNVASVLGFKDTPVPETPALMNKINRVGGALMDKKHGGLREAFNQMMRLHTPDARVERPTFGWIAKAFNTIVRSTKTSELKKVTIPMLIGSAGVESLVDVSTHEKAARVMKDATLIKLPTALHGLWFEDDNNYNLWLKNVKAFVGRVTLNYELAHSHTPADQDAGPDADKIRAAFPVPSRKGPDAPLPESRIS